MRSSVWINRGVLSVAALAVMLANTGCPQVSTEKLEELKLGALDSTDVPSTGSSPEFEDQAGAKSATSKAAEAWMTRNWTQSPGIDMGAVQLAMLSDALRGSVHSAWRATRQEPTSTAALIAADVLFVSPAGQTGEPLPYRDDSVAEISGHPGILLDWQHDGVGFRTAGARVTSGAEQSGTIDLNVMRGQRASAKKIEAALGRPPEPADTIRRNLLIDTQVSLLLLFVSDRQGLPKSYDDLLGFFDLRPLGSGVPVDSGAVPKAGSLLLEAHDVDRIIRWRTVDEHGTYRMRSRVRFDPSYQSIKRPGGPGPVAGWGPEEHLQSAGWRTIATFQL